MRVDPHTAPNSVAAKSSGSFSHASVTKARTVGRSGIQVGWTAVAPGRSLLGKRADRNEASIFGRFPKSVWLGVGVVWGSAPRFVSFIQTWENTGRRKNVANWELEGGSRNGAWEVASLGGRFPGHSVWGNVVRGKRRSLKFTLFKHRTRRRGARMW